MHEESCIRRKKLKNIGVNNNISSNPSEKPTVEKKLENACGMSSKH